MELCRVTGQHGEADNLEHFLTSPMALRKTPYLVLLGPGGDSNQPIVNGVAGAVLAFEYRVAKIGLRLFASSDWTGRRNVIGPVQDRARITATACRVLMERGAQIVFIAYHSPDPALAVSDAAEIRRILSAPPCDSGRSTVVPRDVPLYLPLEATFDKTLARIGRKTRLNLRYYRRRAEAELGCTFVPDVKLSLDEFLAFNHASTYAVPNEAAAARYAAQSTLRHPFLYGTRAADGRWLSLVGGWLRHDALEIEWQMNRDDLPAYSLVTVIRSYLIEHAVELGLKRLYMEGGTPQSIQNSFIVEAATDVTVARRSVYARLIQRFARRLQPTNNYLHTLLKQPKPHWYHW
jgi:hypothetical protein